METMMMMGTMRRRPMTMDAPKSPGMSSRLSWLSDLTSLPTDTAVGLGFFTTTNFSVANR